MLSVALVGFGWWGRTIASRLKENSLFELVCVVEPNSDVHSDIKEMGLKPISDFDEAVKMKNVSALILTSPNDFHDTLIQTNYFLLVERLWFDPTNQTRQVLLITFKILS